MFPSGGGARAPKFGILNGNIEQSIKIEVFSVSNYEYQIFNPTPIGPHV